MAEYKNVTAIKKEIQKICDNCWHPYRLGGCPEHCGINEAVKAIDSVHPVDAVPVVHGRWKCADDLYENAVCSVCGWETSDPWTVIKTWCKFCPNCGARMDGEQA